MPESRVLHNMLGSEAYIKRPGANITLKLTVVITEAFIVLSLALFLSAFINGVLH